ncbi:MAG: hypothetical protein KDB63_07465 [Nocardioidaceae bacterium]|nr:hypothetical protein [Nocardioidaceae bacterium]
MTTGATSSLERITIKLPDDFDPQRHGCAIELRIAKEYGAGFVIDSVNLTRKTVTASRLAAIAEVTQDEHDESFQARVGASL